MNAQTIVVAILFSVLGSLFVLISLALLGILTPESGAIVGAVVVIIDVTLMVIGMMIMKRYRPEDKV